jgi:hypothetical protein
MLYFMGINATYVKGVFHRIVWHSVILRFGYSRLCSWFLVLGVTKCLSCSNIWIMSQKN